MNRRATFTQAELTRAIKGARAAGMTVAKCEITPDGRIVLSDSGTTPADDPYGDWKQRREGRAQGRS